MDTENKKPVFQQLTAEEAKKVRATITRDQCESATECPSGDEREYKACDGRGEGCACCIDGGNFRYGRCQYVEETSGSAWESPRLKCVNS